MTLPKNIVWYLYTYWTYSAMVVQKVLVSTRHQERLQNSDVYDEIVRITRGFASNKSQQITYII